MISTFPSLDCNDSWITHGGCLCLRKSEFYWESLFTPVVEMFTLIKRLFRRLPFTVLLS